MSGVSHPDSSASSAPARFCKQCSYNLRGHFPTPASVLSTQSSSLPPRCPECGRAFDPGDPRTYRKRPPRRWVKHAKRATLALLALFLILAGTWGWFYWGWHDERQALLALKVDPNKPGLVGYTPLVSPALRSRLGSAGFVLDRVRSLPFPAFTAPADLAPVARLTQLQTLTITWAKPGDLGPLTGLTNLHELTVVSAGRLDLAPLHHLTRLESLSLYGPEIRDLSPLAGLGQLQVLIVENTGATDLRPLAGLTNLRTLRLEGTPVRDITPLLALARLQELDLYGTQLSDPAPLAKLTGLRRLMLPRTVTLDQADALRKAMPPDCTITRPRFIE